MAIHDLIAIDQYTRAKRLEPWRKGEAGLQELLDTLGEYLKRKRQEEAFKGTFPQQTTITPPVQPPAVIPQGQGAGGPMVMPRAGTASVGTSPTPDPALLLQEMAGGNPFAGNYIQGAKAIAPTSQFINQEQGGLQEARRNPLTGATNVREIIPPQMQAGGMTPYQRESLDLRKQQMDKPPSPTTPYQDASIDIRKGGLDERKKAREEKSARDADKKREQIEKQLAKLGEDAVKIGNQITALDSGAYIPPGAKEPIPVDSPMKASIRQNFQKLLTNKQNQINQLQKQAGYDKTIPLSYAKDYYGEKAKGWSDDELKKFLSSQGFTVTND